MIMATVMVMVDIIMNMINKNNKQSRRPFTHLQNTMSERTNGHRRIKF